MPVADWGAYSGLTGSRPVPDARAAAYWESADPPYYESVGTLPAEALIDYAYDTQHTELPGTVRISKQAALDALVEFLRTDRLPNCIRWTET
jgi:hypothetical protein